MEATVLVTMWWLSMPAAVQARALTFNDREREPNECPWCFNIVERPNARDGVTRRCNCGFRWCIN